MTTDAHFEAVLALINAELGSMATPRSAYDYDDAPSGADYVLVDLTRRYGGNTRAGRLSPSGWRVTTRAVGSMTTNARVLLDRTTTALENVRIVVGGETSTPVQFETEDPVERDDDKTTWSGLRSWTYAF